MAKVIGLSERETRVILSLTPEAAERAVIDLQRSEVLLGRLAALTEDRSERDACLCTLAYLRLLVKRVDCAPRRRVRVDES